MYSYGTLIWASCSFTIPVSPELIAPNASLVVYMVDSHGQECIGKCQLDHNSAYHKISQDALEITLFQEANSFNTAIDLMSLQASAIDLMSLQASSQDSIILHFEFDSAVRILRILIVKDSLLEENPFDVLTLHLKENLEAMQHTFDEFEQVEELDELSALVDNIDAEVMDQVLLTQERKASRLEKYMLFAEIYMLMQYGKMKRAMHGVINSWFFNS